MADQSQVRREFAARFERALTDYPGGAAKLPKQKDKDYAELSHYIVGLGKPDALDACLLEYLARYPKFPATDRRSKFAFIVLLTERIKITPVGAPYLTSLLNSLLHPPSPRPPVWARFQDLTAPEQKEITTPLEAKLAKSRDATTLLDLLRDEYLRQKNQPAAGDSDLYGFDPAPSPALKSELDTQIERVQAAWKNSVLGNEEMPRIYFHLAVESYRAYLIAFSTQGVLTLFQVIKYLQDRISTRRESMRGGTKVIAGDRSPLMCELYSMACLQLLVLAQGKLLIRANRQQFTPREQAYLLAPLRNPTYEFISELEARFSTPLGSVADKFELSKTFLDLILLSKNQIEGADLVPVGEAKRIQSLWKPLVDLNALFAKSDLAAIAHMCKSPQVVTQLQWLQQMLAIEVPVGSTELGRAVARVGASPGVHASLGRVSIVHIDPGNHDRFYIEFEALKPRLFAVRTIYIERKVFGSRIFGVYEATVGMVYVVQGMFMMMGFMPVFIESGFAGLIYEIAVYLASQEVGDQAKKVHPVFGELVALALQIATPRPNFKPKVVVPTRFTVLETKAGAVLEAPTRQADASFLDRGIEANPVGERGVPSRGAAEPTSPKAEAAPAPRRGWQQQGQQQTTYVPPHAKPVPVGEPPGAPRRTWQEVGVQQQQTKAPPKAPATPGPRSGVRGEPVKLQASEPARATAVELPPRRSRILSAEEKAADSAARQETKAQRREAVADRAKSQRRAGATPREPVDVGTGKNGGRYELHGDAAQFKASKQGHHVYLYVDGHGQLCYAGKSGSITGPGRISRLPPGAPERAFHHWINRLRDSHLATPWIRLARKVRVYYGLSEAEMYALEDWLIEYNRKTVWNELPGEFEQRFGDLGLERDALAASAQQYPHVEFTIDATSAW